MTPPHPETSKWCAPGKDAESHGWCANRSPAESHCKCPCHRLTPRNHQRITAWLSGEPAHPETSAGRANTLIGRLRDVPCALLGASCRNRWSDSPAMWCGACVNHEAATRLQQMREVLEKWERRADRGFDPEEEEDTTVYWRGVRAVCKEALAALAASPEED